MDLVLPDWRNGNTRILRNTEGSSSGLSALVSVIPGRDRKALEAKVVQTSDWPYVIRSGLLDQYWLPRPHAHPLALVSAFTSFDVSWPIVIWKNRDELLDAIRSALESEPFEDGIRHSVETTVRNALHDPRSRDWIRAAILENLEDFFTSDLLRCIGRMEYWLIGRWGTELAEAALASRSVEVRDASLQALESWGRPSLVALRAHLGREQTSWLRAYTDQVIRDLQT